VNGLVIHRRVGGGLHAGSGVRRGWSCACRRAVAVVATVAAVGSAAGCGKAPPVLEVAGVTGTVMLDGKPAEHAVVTFIPIDGAPGSGAAATTDAEGRYMLRSVQRTSGLTGQGVRAVDGVPPGRYKVMVSRRLHADGSPMRPDETPIESQAVETIAPAFSDELSTTLSADVPAAGGTFDWTVKPASRR
jgi:hypothetical protein